MITLRLRHRIADDAETPPHAPVSITTQCRGLKRAQARAVLWLLSPKPDSMERSGDRPPTDTHPVAEAGVACQVSPRRYRRADGQCSHARARAASRQCNWTGGCNTSYHRTAHRTLSTRAAVRLLLALNVGGATVFRVVNCRVSQ